MSVGGSEAGRLRLGCALALCGALLVTGVGLALASDPSTYSLSVPLPAVLALLIAGYVAGSQYSLDYEFRRNSQSVTLVQLPLALGVQVVMPLVHVAARAVASLSFVVTQRQDPLKALYNLGSSCFEVGAATFAVSLVDGNQGPEHWIALYLGLLIG
ncbi:MAG: Diguanylate cyclase/phosphodiesterase, partial [Frankiales bacterium]|nr:Diguanylate cyclase/phosphodiesterase [Frankiales bacterium]